jgi:hypothetical protein
VSDEEWAFMTPHLTLMTEDSSQREVFNGLFTDQWWSTTTDVSGLP